MLERLNFSFLNFLLWSLFSIQWISLRELLTRCGRRLTVNELWALCYTCLSSLQTYIDFPGDINRFTHEIKVLNYFILTAPARTVEIPTCSILAHICLACRWKYSEEGDRALWLAFCCTQFLSVQLISLLSVSLFMSGHSAYGLRWRSTFLET